MGNFDKYSNKPNKAPFLGVTFGFNRLVLEVELNEAQQIQNERMLALMNIHGDCVINRDGFSYDGTSLTFDTKVVKDGIIIDTTGTVFAVSNGESVYIKSEVVDYTFSDTIHENGNTNGAVIENTLKDSRARGLETTRRKGYTFTINKENGMLIGTIVDNNFVCLAPDYSSGIHRYITDSVSAPSKKGGIKVNRLYGTVTQMHYSGKNLLNCSGLVEQTINGVTFTPTYTNGMLRYISVGGTATDEVIYAIPINLSANTTYIANGRPSSTLVSTINISIRSSDYATIYAEYGTKFTPTGDIVAAYCVSIVKGTIANSIIYPMVRLASETPAYEPYVGGIPSPNPDHPQKIKSTISPAVTVLGKNIFYDTDVFENTSNGVTWNMSSGHITASGTPTGDSSLELSSAYTFLPKKNKYTLSLQGTTTNVIMKLLLMDSNLMVVDILTGNVITFDISNYDEYVSFYDVKFCSVESGVEVKCDAYLQLENSDTKTFYEPCSGTGASLPHTLNAVPVESGGNVTIDGQQYISDYIDFEKKQLIRMVGKIESYNSEEITTNYISTSGELSTGATVLYELSASTVVDLTDKEVKPFFELNSHSGVTNLFARSDISEDGIFTPPILDFEIATTETGAKSLENKNKCTAIAGEVASMTKIVVSNTEPDDKSVVWVQ